MILQGTDLRTYAKEVERELLDVENASIQDCILCQFSFDLLWNIHLKFKISIWSSSKGVWFKINENIIYINDTKSYQKYDAGSSQVMQFWQTILILEF